MDKQALKDLILDIEQAYSGHGVCPPDLSSAQYSGAYPKLMGDSVIRVSNVTKDEMLLDGTPKRVKGYVAYFEATRVDSSAPAGVRHTYAKSRPAKTELEAVEGVPVSLIAAIDARCCGAEGT